MSLIQAENLTKIYGSGETTVTALDHVNLKVETGEFVAVMGPSGCGKSTLLHLIGGLDRPTEGEVVIDGTPLAAMKDDDLTKLRRKRIGFVFQFYNLIPVLTAAENAALPVTLDGIKPAEAKKRAAEWLQRFGLMLMMFYDGMMAGFEEAIYGNAIRVLGGNIRIHAAGMLHSVQALLS